LIDFVERFKYAITQEPFIEVLFLKRPQKKPTIIKIPETPHPHEVPYHKLTNLSRKYINWKKIMIAVIFILLVFMVLNVIVSSPFITGYAVSGDNSLNQERFMGTASLLAVIFAFFTLFILIVNKKVKR